MDRLSGSVWGYGKAKGLIMYDIYQYHKALPKPLYYVFSEYFTNVCVTTGGWFNIFHDDTKINKFK